jgi:S1-C subfamily serine protease
MTRIAMMIAIVLGIVAASSSAVADKTRTPRLGVQVIGLTTELRAHFGAATDRGVLVGRVEPGSAAARGGILVGDVIVAVDGVPVADAADVRAALVGKKAGAKVDVDVVRDGATRTITATMTASPHAMLRMPLVPIEVQRWIEQRMSARNQTD